MATKKRSTEPASAESLVASMVERAAGTDIIPVYARGMRLSDTPRAQITRAEARKSVKAGRAKWGRGQKHIWVPGKD